jgi:hypothetical protein
VWLKNNDRLIFVWLYRLFPSILNAITVVKPETVIGWIGVMHFAPLGPRCHDPTRVFLDISRRAIAR